jgi:hypothetical protein
MAVTHFKDSRTPLPLIRILHRNSNRQCSIRLHLSNYTNRMQCSQNGGSPFAGQPVSPMSPLTGYSSSPSTSRKNWGSMSSTVRTSNQAATPQRNGGRGTAIPTCYRCTLKGPMQTTVANKRVRWRGLKLEPDLKTIDGDSRERHSA